MKALNVTNHVVWKRRVRRKKRLVLSLNVAIVQNTVFIQLSSADKRCQLVSDDTVHLITCVVIVIGAFVLHNKTSAHTTDSDRTIFFLSKKKNAQIRTKGKC